MIKRSLQTFLLVLAAVLATGVPAQSLQPIDRIAAIVDEDVILQSELDRAVRNVVAQYAGRAGELPPADILRKQVLERLVLLRLQVSRARDTGILATDQDIEAALGNIARQNNTTPQAMAQQLAAQGQSMADFRRSLAEEIVIQRLRQRFAQSSISVSEAEVDAAMSRQSGTQYRLAHILVALPEGATPEQIALGQKKIDGVKALIDKGEMSFAAAATRYSDSQNALEGGDLGWRTLDEIPTGFASTVQTLQPGQMFGPTRGPSGFQLVQLVETRDAAQASAGKVTQYQARHILIRNADGVTDAQAKATIEALRARIAGGADFATVARESTQDDGSRASGGDLGWFNADQFGPEFAAQLPALTDGQVSAPFKTQAGWHIVQRQGVREVAATDDNRRALVRQQIGERKLEEEWTRFLREMRGEAYVDIRADKAPAP